MCLILKTLSITIFCLESFMKYTCGICMTGSSGETDGHLKVTSGISPLIIKNTKSAKKISFGRVF